MSKVSLSAGDLDGHSIILLQASASFRLSHEFGLQLDGFGAHAKDDLSAGFGGHLFWRNPETGLFGLYGSSLDRGWENIDGIGNFGFEGEIYLDDFTVSALVGTQFDDEDEPFFLTMLTWYSDDEDMLLYGGFGRQIGLDMVHLGFEYDPSWQSAKNTTFFLGSIIAGCDETLVHAGLRFYFGADKSLKSRHREDDPIISTMPGNLLNLDHCGNNAMITGGGGGMGL